MRRRALLCIACALVLITPAPTFASQPSVACRPHISGALPTDGRVDGIVALPHSAAALLIDRRHGEPGISVHDQLLLVDTHPLQVRLRLQLPASSVPPGLAVLEGGEEVAVVIDDRLLVLNVPSGRVRHWWGLDMAAVGWPAAVAGLGNRLYVAGQPRSSSVPTARLEAFEVAANGSRLRAIWRTNLGLTHAGIWLGIAARDKLAVYLPDAHDLAGIISTWSARSGVLQASYAVPGPVLSVDQYLNRFYGSIGGRIYSRAIGRDGAMQEQAGTGPIAVDPSRGLLLFAHGMAVVVASARSLRPMGGIRLADPETMAVADNGATLLVGLPTGLARIDLGSCGAHTSTVS